MKYLFKQKAFSWLGSYDVYDEFENTAFKVKGKVAWGHKLEIYDHRGEAIGTIKEKVMNLLPKFEMYYKGEYIGSIKKEFTLLKPKFTLDYQQWRVEGNLLEWDYKVYNNQNNLVADINKVHFKLTDTYEIDIVKPEYAITTLMIVIAIDAAKATASAGATAGV